jgi:hypothetical protein
VLPVPLITTVFARYGEKAISELELKVQVERLAEELRARGAHVYVPRRDFDYAINVGLRMLLLRHLVDERDGLYYARVEELPLLRYYANSIRTSREGLDGGSASLNWQQRGRHRNMAVSRKRPAKARKRPGAIRRAALSLRRPLLRLVLEQDKELRFTHVQIGDDVPAGARPGAEPHRPPALGDRH